MTARSWEMHGHEIDGPKYLHVNADARTTRAYSERHQLKLLRVTEDPEGEYRGWLRNDDDTGEAVETLSLVQHQRLFNMQFPYGYQAEQDRGRGVMVPLRIEVIRDVDLSEVPRIGS